MKTRNWISVDIRLISLHLFLIIIGLTFYGLFTLAGAASIAEEFSSNNALVNGSLVSKVDDSSPIELSNINNDLYFLGAVTQSSNSLVTITKVDANTPVAISGEVNILASDINGEIEEGDLLTLSWINGVAMKLTDDINARVVGVALEDFSAVGANTYGKIETSRGQVDETKVNQIYVRLTGSDAFASQQRNNESYGLVEKLTGKDVSLVRLVSGLFVFITTFVIASVFIYSSIKGSFISFGRNPLASNSIYAGLLQVSAISVVIIAVGATVAYLIWVI
jgi:hypothetical protein